MAAGIAAGAALLFAAPAIGFAGWSRHRQRDYFYDIPG